MIESYLDIETDPARIPQTRGNHQPILSHFAFHTTHAPSVGLFRYQRAIFWKPGDRVFLAASARIVTGSTCTFAWGAGVPFNPRSHGDGDDDAGHKPARIAHRVSVDPADHGGDGDGDDGDDGDDRGPRTRNATYFSFTPLGIETHGQGPGWVSTHVGGTIDDTGQTFQADLLMIQPGAGLADAPIPATLQADFSSDADFSSSEYSLDASIVSEIERSTQLGQLTPALLAIAEPLDPLLPSSTVRPFGLFGKCSDQAITKTKSLNLQGNAEAEQHLALKRFKFFGACIPYSVKFIDLHGFGSALVNFDATLDGLLSFDSSGLKHPLVDFEFLNPTLTEILFFCWTHSSRHQNFATSIDRARSQGQPQRIHHVQQLTNQPGSI